MTLESPPMIEHLLLEQPWPLAVVFGIIGIGLFVIASRNAKPKLRYAGLGSFILATGVIALASFVTTDREEVTELTRQLVHMTAPFRGAPLRAQFDDAAVFNGAEGDRWFQAAPGLIALELAIKKYGISEHSIRDIACETDSPGRASCWVRVHTNVGGQGVNTDWLFTWRKQKDGQWRVMVIQGLKINGQTMGRGILSGR
jgi:hypothetical protein